MPKAYGKRRRALSEHKTMQVLQLMGDERSTDHETITACMKVTKWTRRKTQSYVLNLKVHGAARDVPVTGSDGTFLVPSLPELTSRRIFGPDQADVILSTLRQCLDNVSMESGVESGEGPPCKSIEILANGVLQNKKLKPLVQALEPVFEKCALLLQETVSCCVPSRPPRVFANCYPRGTNSGMVTHRDSHTVCGAVTLALSNDECGGCLYVTTGNESNVVGDVMLQKGFAVAMPPHTWHGVHTLERAVSRYTINMFF